MAQIEVNARRLLCPMPVIKLQQAVDKANTGDRITITCTDPGAMNDIPAWCRVNGHTLETAAQVENDYIFNILVHEC